MSRKALKGARTLVMFGLAVAFAATAARAQTPEGTTIRNIASATYTDANSNSYAAVADTVDVTVGFQAGVDVIAAAATVNPASPSTANTISFDVDNIGNGADSVTASQNITVGGIITVTGYRINGGTWLTTLAELNDSLALTSIATGAGNGITIDVRYDVASGQGGQSTVYQFTAMSRRDAGTSDMDQTTITPGETLGVAVTPDGGQNLTHLPSNGTDYTFTFNVENTGDGPEDFDLRALFVDVADISIVSVNGVAGDSTQISLAAGANQNIDVIYSVLDRPAGTQDTVYLRARSVTGPGTAADSGYADLTIVRPALSITKEAFTDAGLTTPVSGNVLPGQTIYYKITVSNSSTNSADATSIDVDDDLPSEVTYVSHGDDSSGWTITKLNGPPEHLDATLASLAPGASAYFWVEVTIN